MLTTVMIGGRNLLRNRRRSLTTLAAIAVGTVAVLVFGGFQASVRLGLETSIVRSEAHLHIYPAGYLDYGASRPAEYVIEAPDSLIARIRAERDLAERIRLATPVLRLVGIAGNYAEDSSKTFIGLGLRPSDHDALASFDPHGLGGRPAPLAMRDGDADTGVVGVGMARMLGLCDELAMPDCRDRPARPDSGIADAGIGDLQTLAAADLPASRHGRIDLMAATSAGAPNVVSLRPVEARRQPVAALDDAFVAMPLALAQRLVHGGADRATAVIIQLHDVADAPAVKARLEAMLAGLPLEVRGLDDINPMYRRILAMFATIFGFIAAVVGLVVLFTVVNTMTMVVMERVSEIGTLRALGLRRSGVRRQFLVEGALIGLAGASLGVLVALLVAELVNHAGLAWTPPSNSDAQPLRLLLTDPVLLGGVWSAMVVLAAAAALPPANKAARLPVVDALRHV